MRILDFCGKSWGSACAKICAWWYNEGMAFIRKFETTSGATGVQVCYKEGGRVVKTIHVGSASTPEALERLVKKAQGIINEKDNPLFDLSVFDKK